MAVQTRAIKRRIKSVKNTKKITKAMEMVSASKMRKAMQAMFQSRPYANLAWNIVSKIAQLSDSSIHPFLKSPKGANQYLFVCIASDRGLAGGYNANIQKKIVETVKIYDKQNLHAICIGRRSSDAIRKWDIPIIAHFTDISNQTLFSEMLPIAKLIMSEYLTFQYKKIFIISTKFHSALSQEVICETLLPLQIEESEESITESSEILFEPSQKDVLDKMLPSIIETKIFQSILDASSSEHSSRMMAMKNASDSAKEMIEDLTFTYNQARQSGITQEIAEISSGKAALEQS